MAKSMQKTVEEGEQGTLIEVGPENGEAIIAAVRVYKEHQTARLALLKKEIKSRNRVKALVKEANLTPLKDGTIKFTLDKVTICVKPRDELITITEEKPKKSKKKK